MMNHPGGSRLAPNIVSARIAAALHLSAFKIYWKNTWKNKILIKHSACAGNNYEPIQRPQKNLQYHVRFWILWKQCISTSNTLAQFQTHKTSEKAQELRFSANTVLVRVATSFWNAPWPSPSKILSFLPLQLVSITKSSVTGHRTWETFATLILGLWNAFKLSPSDGASPVAVSTGFEILYMKPCKFSFFLHAWEIEPAASKPTSPSSRQKRKKHEKWRTSDYQIRKPETATKNGVAHDFLLISSCKKIWLPFW